MKRKFTYAEASYTDHLAKSKPQNVISVVTGSSRNKSSTPSRSASVQKSNRSDKSKRSLAASLVTSEYDQEDSEIELGLSSMQSASQSKPSQSFQKNQKNIPASVQQNPKLQIVNSSQSGSNASESRISAPSSVVHTNVTSIGNQSEQEQVSNTQTTMKSQHSSNSYIKPKTRTQLTADERRKRFHMKKLMAVEESLTKLSQQTNSNQDYEQDEDDSEEDNKKQAAKNKALQEKINKIEDQESEYGSEYDEEEDEKDDAKKFKSASSPTLEKGKSPKKTPGKPPKYKKPREMRADIVTRLGITEQEYNKIPNKDPFVNKMIMNQVIPQEIKAITKKADEAFGNLLNVARTTKEYDFEDGVYFAMPKDPRGHQLMLIRKAAEEKTAAIESEFKNLAIAINLDSVKATTRTSSQQLALKLLHDPSKKKEEPDEDPDGGNTFLNREQVQVDIRTVSPSNIAVRSITNKITKANFQGEALRERIKAEADMEKFERERKFFQQTAKLREKIEAINEAEKMEESLQQSQKSENASPLVKKSNKSELVEVKLNQSKSQVVIPGLKTFLNERKSILAELSIHNSINSINSQERQDVLQALLKPQQNKETSLLDKFSPQNLAANQPKIYLKRGNEQSTDRNTNIDSPSPQEASPSKKKKLKDHVKSPKITTQVMNQIAFEQVGVLIKPGVDASDKEMHMRNKFNHQAKNLAQFVQQAYKDSDFVKQVFKPRRLGQMSKNNLGKKVNTHVKTNTPDFKRVEYIDDGRKLSVPSKPPLPPTVSPKPLKKVHLKDSKKNQEINKVVEDVQGASGDWKRVNLTEVTQFDYSVGGDQDQSTMASMNTRKSLSRGGTSHYQSEATFHQSAQSFTKDRSIARSRSQVNNSMAQPQTDRSLSQSEDAGTMREANDQSTFTSKRQQSNGKRLQKNKEGVVNCLKVAKFFGTSIAQTAQMASIIESVAKDMDILDRQQVQKGEKYLLVTDENRIDINDQHYSKEKGNNSSRSFQTQDELDTARKAKIDTRVKRNKLMGSEVVPQRKTAYLSDKIQEAAIARTVNQTGNRVSKKRKVPAFESINDKGENKFINKLRAEQSKKIELDKIIEEKLQKQAEELQERLLQASKLSMSLQNSSVEKIQEKLQDGFLGLTKDRKYQGFEENVQINVLNLRTDKIIAPYRVVDQGLLKVFLADNRREEEEFRSHIRQSKKKRNLEQAELQMLLDEQSKVKDKSDKDYEREGKKIIRDEVEDAVLEKYTDHKDRNFSTKEEDEIQQLKKQAIVDQMLGNRKYLTSLSVQKRVWTGDDGMFAKPDLTGWFRIYNQTGLQKQQRFFARSQSEYEHRAQIYQTLARVRGNMALEMVREKDDSELDQLLN